MNITDANGEKCRQSSSCSSRENLSAPFAHKVGPHENFVNSMDKTGRRFEYVRKMFPNGVTKKSRRVYL